MQTHDHIVTNEPNEETLLIDAATKLVVEDGRAFRIIDTRAFKEFISTVADVA